MKFYEIVDQVAELLQRRGRVAYRALKVEFALNDEQLAALKEELIDIQEIAVDKDGKMLVWTGAPAVVSCQLPVPLNFLLPTRRPPNSALPQPQPGSDGS